MMLFIGTLLIILACCAVMAFAVSLSGKPLPGGCGKQAPEAARCDNCPNRGHRRCPGKGETP